MSVRKACAVAGALLLVSGCASNRAGILRTLPLPVTRTDVGTESESRLPVRAPVTPVQTTVLDASERSWLPPGGIRDRWETIVIHHSGSVTGNAASFDRYHRNVRHWDELGYHFVIGNGHGSGDGEIEVGSRWAKQKHGAHCKTPDNYYNAHGIGICLVGDFRLAPPTPAQLSSLTRLVRFLMRECDVPPERVVTHRDVTGKTICPGAMFPLYTLRQRVLASGRVGALP